MTSVDLAQLLATAARPLTRAEAIHRGMIVDCTQAASWLGFQLPAAMSLAAWDETVGHHTVASTTRERVEAGARLREVWKAAASACLAYRQAGVVRDRLHFTTGSVAGKRLARLVLSVSLDGGQPVVTITLEGEQ